MEANNDSKTLISKQITHASTKISFMLLAFLVLVTVLCRGAEKLCILIFDPMTKTASALSLLIIYSVQYLVAVPACILIGKYNESFSLKKMFVKPQCSAGFIIKWLFIGYAIMQITNLFFNMLFSIIQKAAGVNFFEPSIGNFSSGLEAAVTFFVVAGFAPIFEELLCRGAMLKNIEKFGPMFTIVVVGVYFGLMHRNYAQIFYAASGGMVMCFLCLKTRSIISSYIFHFFCNLIGSTGMLVYNKAGISDQTGYEQIYEKITSGGIINILMIGAYALFVYGVIFAGAILLIIELCCHRKNFKIENTCTELTGLQKAGAFLRSPVTLITILIYIGVIIINASGLMYI